MLFAIKCHASESYLASVPSRTGSEWTGEIGFARKFSTTADLESFVASRKLSKVVCRPVDPAYIDDLTAILHESEMADRDDGRSLDSVFRGVAS